MPLFVIASTLMWFGFAKSYKILLRGYEGSTGVSTSVMTMASEEGKKRVLKKSEWEGNHKYLNASAICLKSE